MHKHCGDCLTKNERKWEKDGMEAREIRWTESEKNPRERERFGRDEYLVPEFSEKRLERRRFVETVGMKEIGEVFRSSRSRSLKSDYKKGWQRWRVPVLQHLTYTRLDSFHLFTFYNFIKMKKMWAHEPS